MAGYKDIAAESPLVPDDGKPYEWHASRTYKEHFGHAPPAHLVQHWRAGTTAKDLERFRMSSRKEHCRRSKETFGEEFNEVHAWLDELANAGDGMMDLNHRIHRHNTEGVDYIRNRWGVGAARAAEQHIIDDLGGVYSKEELIKMSPFGEEQNLMPWDEVFGGK